MSDKIKDLLAQPVAIRALSLRFQKEREQLETLPVSEYRNRIENIIDFWEDTEVTPSEEAIEAIRNVVESLLILNKIKTPKPKHPHSPPIELPKIGAAAFEKEIKQLNERVEKGEIEKGVADGMIKTIEVANVGDFEALEWAINKLLQS